MILNLSDVSAEPLHRQISRQIRAKILARDLAGNEPLPSIRSMAKEQKVSVITVQRAYDDLEREGLILARRGKGFFVAAIPPQRRQTMAERRFADALSRLFETSSSEGLDREQIRQIFDQTLSRWEDGK